MRIGIITLFNNGNVGASLQAYALNYTLRSLGHSCEDIQYKRMVDGKNDSDSQLSDRLHLLLSASGRKDFIVKVIGRVFLKNKRNARNRVMLEFSKRYIPQTETVYFGSKELEKENFDYDCYICGSDNIWQKKKFDPTFFLSFVSDDKLKFSYAAGFSTTSLNNDEANNMIPLIERLDAISVRENYGAELLKKFTSHKVYQHIDPTLLLDRFEWDSIMAHDYQTPENYIFCYILGPESEPRKFAKWLSNIEKIPIVAFPHATSIQRNDIGFADFNIYNAGPSEFITLIANAKYVITDSFHGSVFSILYHKQFLSFKRFKNSDTKELDLRLESLFQILKLDCRIPSDNNQDAMSLLKKGIDFERVDLEIAKLREQAISYLREMTS